MPTHLESLSSLRNLCVHFAYLLVSPSGVPSQASATVEALLFLERPGFDAARLQRRTLVAGLAGSGFVAGRSFGL